MKTFDSLRKVYIIMKVCWLNLKRDSSWVIRITISPFFFALTAMFIFKDLDFNYFISYILVGSTVMGMWISNVLVTGYEIRTELNQGTLTHLLLTGTKLHFLILSRGFLYTSLGLLSFIGIFFIACLVNGSVITINYFTFLPTLLFAVFNLSFLGLLLSAAFVLLREFSSLSTILTRLLFILCGVMFPITFLPEYIRFLSYVLSPTWIVILLREVVSNTVNFERILLLIGIILVLTFIYTILSFKLYNHLENTIRKQNELGV